MNTALLHSFVKRIALLLRHMLGELDTETPCEKRKRAYAQALVARGKL